MQHFQTIIKISESFLSGQLSHLPFILDTLESTNIIHALESDIVRLTGSSQTSVKSLLEKWCSIIHQFLASPVHNVRLCGSRLGIITLRQSQEFLRKFCKTWITQLMANLKKNPASEDLNAGLTFLIQLLEFEQQQDDGHVVISDIVPKLFQQCVRLCDAGNSHVIIKGLVRLCQKFPGYSKQVHVSVESICLEKIHEWNDQDMINATHCLIAMNNNQDNANGISRVVEKVINTLQTLLNRLFESIEEDKAVSTSDTYPIKLKSDDLIEIEVFSLLNTYVSCLIRILGANEYRDAVINPKTIFPLIQRVFTVNDVVIKSMLDPLLQTLMNSLQASMLNLLAATVARFGDSMSTLSSQIWMILEKYGSLSQISSKSKIHYYEICTRLFFSGPCIPSKTMLEILLKFATNDMLKYAPYSYTDTFTVWKKGNNTKNWKSSSLSLQNSKLLHSDEVEVAVAALSVIQRILTLDYDISQNLRDKSNEGLIWAILNPSYQRRVLHSNVEIALFKTLLVSIASSSQIHKSIYQQSVRIFSGGLNSRYFEVKRVCEEALVCMESLLHGRTPSLYRNRKLPDPVEKADPNSSLIMETDDERLESSRFSVIESNDTKKRKLDEDVSDTSISPKKKDLELKNVALKEDVIAGPAPTLSIPAPSFKSSDIIASIKTSTTLTQPSTSSPSPFSKKPIVESDADDDDDSDDNLLDAELTLDNLVDSDEG
ncbi:hypothetical protein HK098_000333 [Nowakowskiella sp. JEL0407]|nr:hypothetical protein HK098_000333 [Nowakowskiella sp. JEL0407]